MQLDKLDARGPTDRRKEHAKALPAKPSRARSWGRVHTRALKLVRSGGAPAPPRRDPAALEPAVRSLTAALAAKDPYTRAHSTRVSEIAERLARDLRLGEATCRDIALGGIVHDVGKIGVPGSVLHRPGQLTPAELRQVQLHPVIGEEILLPLFDDRANILAIARSHHERPDGTGYPDGLRAERIPLVARIVAVADAFDAMTSRRPYRRAMSVPDALNQLLAHAGTQFDQACVTALIRLVRRGAARRAHATPAPLPVAAGLDPTVSPVPIVLTHPRLRPP